MIFSSNVDKILGKKIVPHLNGDCYVQPGDINLGLLTSSLSRGDEYHCSNSLSDPIKIQYTEMFKYAISEINKNTSILDNITLGFVMMDICQRDLVALARALYFIPDSEMPASHFTKKYAYNCSDALKSFPVTG